MILIKNSFMKNKQYKTPDGHIVKVLDFDEINKMAYINVEGSRHRWVHEPEYSKWEEFNPIYVPETPMEMIESPSKIESHAIVQDDETERSSGEIHKIQVQDTTIQVFQESKEEQNTEDKPKRTRKRKE